MRYALFCTVLLFATITLGEQQGRPPATNPPYQTPPTFPEDRQTPEKQLPPDTQAPPQQTMSSEHVEGMIVEQLKAEPTLANTNLDARVNDNSVVLTGTVDTRTQHDLAVRIASENAGGRKVVDRIKVQQPM